MVSFKVLANFTHLYTVGISSVLYILKGADHETFHMLVLQEDQFLKGIIVEKNIDRYFYTHPTFLAKYMFCTHSLIGKGHLKKNYPKNYPRITF